MTAANPVLYNVAAAGFLAGVLSLQLTDPNGDQVEPTDFATAVTASFVFAAEVDATIAFLESSLELPGPITLLATGNATILPSGYAESNAAMSTPNMMQALCYQAWKGRSVPTLNSDGVTPLPQAGYAGVANFVVQSLIEWAGTASAA